MQRRTLWAIALAAGMIAFAGTPAAAQLFNNTNTLQVHDCPQPVVNCAPSFTLSSPAKVDEIHTYHRATGGSSAGKNLGLKDASGSMIILSAPVTVQPASTGFENWILHVGGQQIPAGTYTVVDSQADTWQQNLQSSSKGFAVVLGSTASSTMKIDLSVTDCLATCTVPPATTSPPTFSCSAHGPHASCKKQPPTGDFPGGGVSCTDGKNTTVCNCQQGCSTH